MNKTKLTSALWRAGAVLLALAVWELCARLLGSRVLLAGPPEVARRAVELMGEASFLATLWHTFSRIVAGFLLALCVGTALGILAGRFVIAETLLRPYMVTVRTVPVASFIILALCFFTPGRLSVLISFLMVLPIIYNGVLQGIRGVDEKMLRAADVFRVPTGRRILYLWMPQVKPHLLSACSVALGLSWKAGVAAEVIGIPAGSIGEALYRAKVYFLTADLLAWTVMIVLLSVAFEKVFLALLRGLFRGLERL